MTPVTYYVNSWTKKQKYDCPECNAKKTIKHADYRCQKCGVVFVLKVRFSS